MAPSDGGEARHARRDDPLLVWRAMLAHTGDSVVAASVVTRSLDGEYHDDGPLSGWRWQQLFDWAGEAMATPGRSSVALLSTTTGGESLADSHVSHLVATLGAIPERQRRALIAKHVGGLSDAEVGKMLRMAPADAASLLTEAQAALNSAAGPEPATDVLSSPEAAARRFDPLWDVQMPTGLVGSARGAGDRRFDSRAVLTTAAVGLVAVVGVVLIAGNPGVVEEALPTTIAAPTPSTSVPAFERQLLARAERESQLAEQLALESALQGPDRSDEILISPVGEIVRLDPASGGELWRTSPLGEIELASVDMNTITIRKNGTVLRVSLADGTFLPP